MNKAFLDVRSKDEFFIDGIEGSLNIPHTEIMNSLDLIPDDREILVYCQTGNRSNIVSRVLERLGFNAVDIKTIRCATSMWEYENR
jgi:rhodanese-related sulfurtransferase